MKGLRMKKYFIFLTFLMLAGILLAAGSLTTPTEKIAAIDAKIVQCDTKPEIIVAEKQSVYDVKIKRCSKGMTKGLQAMKATWTTAKVAEYKIELLAEKAVLEKEIAKDPNDVKPVEVEVIPK